MEGFGAVIEVWDFLRPSFHLPEENSGDFGDGSLATTLEFTRTELRTTGLLSGIMGFGNWKGRSSS